MVAGNLKCLRYRRPADRRGTGGGRGRGAARARAACGARRWRGALVAAGARVHAPRLLTRNAAAAAGRPGSLASQPLQSSGA